MAIQVPEGVLRVLGEFNGRADAFEISDLERAVQNAVGDKNGLSPDARLGWWAEQLALSLSTHDAPDGGPWKTYFQPFGTGVLKDGTVVCSPDLALADAEILAYWEMRAKAATHPVLVARYADLVWDTTEFVTKAKRGREKFEFVGLAIDSYITASRIDDGTAWADTTVNLARALHLALSVQDRNKIHAAVDANIAYVDRTGRDDQIGTYCYLFDNLLPAAKGPELAAGQEDEIVAKFERIFASMAIPGGQYDVDPHSPMEIGVRLAAYYLRKGRPNDRARILSGVAQAFERRAKIGNAMMGLIFLHDARGYYLEAGLREEVERVQLEAQRIGPKAEQQLIRTRISQEIPNEEVVIFLNGMMEGGFEKAILRLASDFIPDQSKLAKQIEQIAKDQPLYAIFSGNAKALNHGHIAADIGDETADPDGKMIHETSRHIQLQAFWIALIFERLIRDGLVPDQLADFVGLSNLFTKERLPIIRHGIQAHFMGDFVQAIHLLVPQIERALVSLPPHIGKPSNKAHRTGRGVMQFKNLNDILLREEWPLTGVPAEDLRMYLLATLAHPKGLNIRNDVCHGLWDIENFTRVASERIIHVLLAISLIRPVRGSADSSPPKPPPTPQPIS